MRPKLFSDFPFLIGSPAMIWQVLFFYLPLGFLCISSFLYILDTGAIGGVTLQKIAFFLRPVYLKIILNSLILALSNACICLTISYPLAYFLTFNSKRFKNVLLFLLIVPFWTNFLLHVYAWFFVLEKKDSLISFYIGLE